MEASERKQLREWAVKGAEQRLVEMAQEAAAIYRAFPELRERRNGLPGVATSKTASGAPVGRKRRTGMSAAQRKAVSERMRRYWAQRRGEGPREATQSQTAGRGRRKMSAAARKRIGEAQRKRWAELKAQTSNAKTAAETANPRPAAKSHKKK